MNNFLNLERCPWCKTATPTLKLHTTLKEGESEVYSCLYQCSRCCKFVMSRHKRKENNSKHSLRIDVFPNDSFRLDENIPKRARDLLQQAQDMANWAHQIRIVANESRHPDENDISASNEDAKQSLDFLMALAELIFVLPARVKHGIEQTTPPA